VLTIVIASFGYGHLAAHCIESVLGQSKKADKILFVDDGWGDCDHLLELYSHQIDEWVVRPENLGTVDNFQNMLQRVQTEFVMFLGADNWLRDDAVELLTDGHDADVVMYDIFVTGSEKKDVSKRHWQECTDLNGGLYWSRAGGHHGSMVYRTELAKAVGGYCANPESIYTEEDLMLFTRMVEAGATICHINEALLYYRRHEYNATRY